MSLDESTGKRVHDLLVSTLIGKLELYKPETLYAPFHHELFGKDRYAIFSFIQSVNTSLGMSVWEQVAVILAESAGYEASRQYKMVGEIDQETTDLITAMHAHLRQGKLALAKDQQVERIRHSIKTGSANNDDPDRTVDLFVKIENVENYIDITTVKPNKKDFESLKRKLLRWAALRLSQDRGANVQTRLAMPYNPYHPKPYTRWTLEGLYDLKAGEVLVEQDFWDFVAGGKVFNDLLSIFHKVGEQLRPVFNGKLSSFS